VSICVRGEPRPDLAMADEEEEFVLNYLPKEASGYYDGST
jgi:hypothetical protein